MAKGAGNLRDRRYAAQQRAIDEIVQSTSHGGISDGIRPTGRAPRGKGGEFADRRWIANKLETEQRRLSQLRSSSRQYRGTKAGRRNESYRRARVQALGEGLRAAEGVARSGGAWMGKKELIADVFAYSSARSTAVR
ncbi:MAG: hypothetical protein GY803_30760 [Chloroflexi bacterium]|nr:hypothetical protein [Chloroflexota bacterium]